MEQIAVVHGDGDVLGAASPVLTVQGSSIGPKCNVRTLVLIKIRRIEGDTCRSW
jgi:hypothetical protein